MEDFDKLYQERKEQADKRAAQLVVELTRAGRQNELFKASADANYRELLYKQFGL